MKKKLMILSGLFLGLTPLIASAAEASCSSIVNLGGDDVGCGVSVMVMMVRVVTSGLVMMGRGGEGGGGGGERET